MEAPHGRTPPQHSASGGCWRTAGLSLPNSPLPSTKDGAVPWVVQGSIPKSRTEGRMRVSAPPRGHLGCLGSGGWPWPRIVRRRDKGQTKSHTPHSGRASSAGLSFAVRRVSFLCKSPGREGRISVFVGEAGGVEKKKKRKGTKPNRQHKDSQGVRRNSDRHRTRAAAMCWEPSLCTPPSAHAVPRGPQGDNSPGAGSQRQRDPRARSHQVTRPCTPVSPRAGDIQPLGCPCPCSPGTELALGTCSRSVPSRFDHGGKQHALLWCFKGHHVHLFPAESSVVNSAEKAKFISSLNLSGFSLQLPNNFMLFLFISR